MNACAEWYQVDADLGKDFCLSPSIAAMLDDHLCRRQNWANESPPTPKHIHEEGGTLLNSKFRIYWTTCTL